MPSQSVRFILAFMTILLAACSDNESTTNSSNDDSPLDANNYRSTLQSALTQLRGEHFNDFIEAPEIADNLFTTQLPDATEYFGPDPYPLGTETTPCDSGSVTRDIIASDAQLLTINTNFSFTECIIQDKQYDGEITVELSGDAPYRLGGQSGTVTMQFNDMEIITGMATPETHTLTGEFVNDSWWATAQIGYTHEYTTELYTETGDSTNLQVSDAYYIQQLDSNYFPDDGRYYQLSEAGSLSLSGEMDQQMIDYSVRIDPVVIYSSKLDAENNPVYDDDIESGLISFSNSAGGSITVAAAESDTALVDYTVNDGMQTFSETDEWLYPVDCNDNSPMNRRSLCDRRR